MKNYYFPLCAGLDEHPVGVLGELPGAGLDEHLGVVHAEVLVELPGVSLDVHLGKVLGEFLGEVPVLGELPGGCLDDHLGKVLGKLLVKGLSGLLGDLPGEAEINNNFS